MLSSKLQTNSWSLKSVNRFIVLVVLCMLMFSINVMIRLLRVIVPLRGFFSYYCCCGSSFPGLFQLPVRLFTGFVRGG